MRFPASPPSLKPVLEGGALPALLPHLKPALADGRYLHWDQLRRRPAPPGLSPEQWWTAQKLARYGSRVEIPGFQDEAGNSFWFCRLDAIDRATHELDRRDAAREMLQAMGDEAARHEYRYDQLIEEAISSSLIEGAKLTTRAEAKAMIRDGRQPSSRGERMVWNNYSAMQRLLALVDRNLTYEDLLEIHGILGADALETPGAEGRLRTSSEQIRVLDETTGETWFVPPPAEQLPARIQDMLAFANQENDGPFLHPLVRAITLHFWLAYLHPFADGNGRMARALFYWQMLRGGYDFAQYLSISGPIDRSPRAYYLAFAYTETDGGDLTYFLLNQLQVLRQAADELLQHLRERSLRLRELSGAIASVEGLHHRQQAALAHLIRNPHPGITINSHASSHGVTYLTARKDLQELEQLGLIRRIRVGRSDRYFPVQGLAERIRRVD